MSSGGLGQCKDCRWWRPDFEPYEGICAIASTGGFAGVEQRAYAVVAEAGAQWAELVTRADFGCNQFEAKDGDE